MAHELPLPDYDDLPVSGIESRIRTLDMAGVRKLLDYEHAHADRPAVVQVLHQRIVQLDGGAQPTGGSPDAVAPEAGSPTGSRGAVGPAEDPGVHPPPHGNPSGPSGQQPRWGS